MQKTIKSSDLEVALKIRTCTYHKIEPDCSASEAVVAAFALYLPRGLPQLAGQARVGKRDSAAVVRVIDGC